MGRRLVLTLAVFVMGGLVGCRAGCEPKPADECELTSGEDSCMRCASLSACGWCESPSDGADGCQKQDEAGGCEGALITTTNACPGPPPPADDEAMTQ